MRLRSSILGALVAVAACNGLLGLDETTADANDLDHDGIVDALDNCPRASNPDQADADADLLGDVCDPFPDLGCPSGTPINQDDDRNGVDDGCEACNMIDTLDEDGDTIVDTCDRCPALPDLAQDDADNDGISGSCDLSIQRQTSGVVFDGFGVDGKPDPTVWNDAIGWVIAGGAAIGTGDLEAKLSLDGTTSGDWSFLVGVALPEEPSNTGGKLIRLAVVEADTPVSEPARCALRFDAEVLQWSLVTIARDGSAQALPFVPQPGPVPLRIALSDNGGKLGFSCDIANLPGVGTTVTGQFQSVALRPAIGADFEASFTYAFIVR